MGRTATGVIGIRLSDDDEVVGMSVIEESNDVLVVTENGFGKRTSEAEYRLQSRGGKGILTSKVTEKTGAVVAVDTIEGDEDLMIITEGGIIIRMDVNDISTLGRNTQGVTLIRMAEDEHVATVAKVEKEDEELDGEEELESTDESETNNEIVDEVEGTNDSETPDTDTTDTEE